jgi:hypothetical protein
MSKERELLTRLVKSGVLGEYSFIAEVKELLAQPETKQEPVAWMYERQNGDFTERILSVGFEKNFDGVTIPLYTSPQNRNPEQEPDVRVDAIDMFRTAVKAAKAHGTVMTSVPLERWGYE